MRVVVAAFPLPAVVPAVAVSPKSEPADQPTETNERRVGAPDADMNDEAPADQPTCLTWPGVDVLTRRVVDECVKNNTIHKLSAESAAKGLDEYTVVLRFCRLRIDAAPPGARKALVLAPTVPLVRQYFNAARRTQGLRAQMIIGTSDVDAWGRKEWREVVERNHLVAITPQLFLDALKAEHLWMGEFCAVTFNECQHCIGSHPFSKIVSELAIMQPSDRVGCAIRVLGLGRRLFKAKIKDLAEQEAAVKRLAQALHANVRDAADFI